MKRYFGYEVANGAQLTLVAINDEEFARGQFAVLAEAPNGQTTSFSAYSPMSMPREVGQKLLIHLLNPYTREANYTLTTPIVDVFLDHTILDTVAPE